MSEEHLGDPGVLGNHGVGRRKRAERPERNIAEVADWRGDDMQARLDRLGLGTQAESDEAALLARRNGVSFRLGGVGTDHRSSKKRICSKYRTNSCRNVKPYFDRKIAAE